MLDVKKTVVGELEYCYSLAMLHYKGKITFYVQQNNRLRAI